MKFNLTRFGLLLKSDLFSNYRTILIFTASVASMLFLYSLIFSGGAMAGNFHPRIYLLLLFIGGFWTSSLAFKDLHDKQKNYVVLTLPCSNFEKFLSKLILTSVGYVCAITVGFYLLSLLVAGLDALLLHVGQSTFNPFRNGILYYIRDYLILQSVFLLGSIYFRKHSISKTILFLSCLAIVLVLFSLIVSVLFLGPHILVAIFMATKAPRMAKFVFLVLLAPVCWLIAYKRLCEIEV